MPLALNKTYKDAAEAVKKHLQDPVMTEKTRDIGEVKQNVLEVIGLFEHFDMYDMEMHKWELKFEFLDVEAKTDEEKKMRADMVQTMVETDQTDVIPMFTSKTSMFVYKKVSKEVITKIDGKVTDTQKSDDWVDFTREWVQRLQRQDMMRHDL